MGGAGAPAGALRGDGGRRYAVPAAQPGGPAGGGDGGRARRHGGGSIGRAVASGVCSLAGDAYRAVAAGHRRGRDPQGRPFHRALSGGDSRVRRPADRSVLQHQHAGRACRSRAAVGAGAAMTRRVLGIAGFKNTGKTTLVTRLVAELTRRGFRISTVKHAHHSFDIDHEGRDSYHHREAGAREVAVVSRYRWALMHELDGTETDEPRLYDILDKLEPCDLVLVEGYKRDRNHPKIEIRDVRQDSPRLVDDPTVIAVAANGAVENAGVPVFDRDDIAGLADFVVAWAELKK